MWAVDTFSELKATGGSTGYACNTVAILFALSHADFGHLEYNSSSILLLFYILFYQFKEETSKPWD